MTCLSVPANILLFGEYAVLEEGGLGIAAAVEHRVVVTSMAADRLSLQGRWGGRSVAWSPGREAGASDETALFAVTIEACERALAKRGSRAAGRAVRIEVDSTALFDRGGTKRGYGSSAAVAVALTAALLEARLAERPIDEELVFEAALDAHRSLQGGRGSGYDVATSLAGGMLLFVGGGRPRYRRVSLPWLPPFTFVQAAHPVGTPGAIDRYGEWKRANPHAAARFLARSNELVETLLASRSWEEARPAVAEAIERGITLGRAIGVPAEMGPVAGASGHESPAPSDQAPGGMLVKGLGAGNEVAAVWARSGGPPPGAPVAIAERGLTWNE